MTALYFVMCAVFQVQIKLNSNCVSKVTGNLLYHIATRFKGSPERASLLLDYVCTEKIATEQQLTGVALAT